MQGWLFLGPPSLRSLTHKALGRREILLMLLCEEGKLAASAPIHVLPE